MLIAFIILLAPLFASIVVVSARERFKGWGAIIGITVSAVATSILALKSLYGETFQYIIDGGFVFGAIRIEIDPLSAWFLLLMNFTMLTSVFYGRGYMKAYTGQDVRLNLHWISLLFNHAAMSSIYIMRNSLAFLVVWEVLALTAFLLIIFEHHKMETLKAGINYLIQSHISIVFLMAGFIWVSGNQHNYDFNAVTIYCSNNSSAAGVLLFILFLIGFGLKAGFIPLHTWLPYAHPAAPAHISGMMSGVIIKLGIYGIMRMILLEGSNWLVIGSIMLILGVLSGLYGVMLAIVQHNLKRLLAYHSIENIGIIGIGIGIGSIGMANGNTLVGFAGFSGALLHVLNHSLFKSLLFYGSGIVYQAIHTLNIDSMGGLIRQLPRTAFLFLIAALAITGLPPFNGFISEFLIYSGLFQSIHSGEFSYTSLYILSIIGLVLIGGLALLCFTKAFGIIFLGEPRSHFQEDFKDPRDGRLIPMYLIVLLIAFIGLVPQLFLTALMRPVMQFTGPLTPTAILPLLAVMQQVSLAAVVLILLIALIWYIRRWVTSYAPVTKGPTWGCSCQTASPKLQYTASSYVRGYRKLVESILLITRHRPRIDTVVPRSEHFSTHSYDRLENAIIDIPVRKLKGFIGRFNFLQNGSIQFYVLYGIIFIFVILAIPLILEGLVFVYELIKQL